MIVAKRNPFAVDQIVRCNIYEERWMVYDDAVSSHITLGFILEVALLIVTQACPIGLFKQFTFYVHIG